MHLSWWCLFLDLLVASEEEKDSWQFGSVCVVFDRKGIYTIVESYSILSWNHTNVSYFVLFWKSLDDFCSTLLFSVQTQFFRVKIEEFACLSVSEVEIKLIKFNLNCDQYLLKPNEIKPKLSKS